jgi:hypothetical protein
MQRLRLLLERSKVDVAKDANVFSMNGQPAPGKWEITDFDEFHSLLLEASEQNNKLCFVVGFMK